MTINYSPITNTFITVGANIDVHPDEAKESKESSQDVDGKDRIPSAENQFTIPDLHGNTLKLIFSLERQKIINIDKNDYPDLVRIYKKGSGVSKEDLATLDAILAKITANPVGTLRLIGDEFSDRGN